MTQITPKADIYILGVNDGHNSTACLLKNGEIIAAAAEERFNRIKNYIGYPRQASQYCLKEAGISYEELDYIVLSWQNPIPLLFYSDSEHTKSSKLILKKLGPFIYDNWHRLEYYFPALSRIYNFAYNVYSKTMWPRLNQVRKDSIAGLTNVDRNKIICCNHHLAHAYAANFMNKDWEAKKLIFTLDGFGDDCCARVTETEKGVFGEIANTQNKHSLGVLYGEATVFLGMKMMEHEYKVMGMAPYACKYNSKKSYEFFKKLIWVEDDLTFNTKIDSRTYHAYLKRNLLYHRFDGICSGVQRLTEELITEWISKSIEKRNIYNVSVGGGLFLNVKANMKISQMDKIQNVYFTPSAGDESTAIGAAYYGYQLVCKQFNREFNPKSVQNLYLGPQYQNEEIEKFIRANKEITAEALGVEKVEDIEGRVAHLLAEGKTIGRFNGRMEWGARALGNRSILADPSREGVVKKINEQIKCRDFWMPFCPTVLVERAKDYIVNSKNRQAPFMVLAFESTDLARQELKGAMHPYDHTVRPQVLDKATNPRYYKLLKEFEAITGRGGILNTSFNLHGEPIVCSPQDAIYTFVNSGLDCLALGDFIISKTH